VPGVHEFCLASNDGAAEVRPMMEAARAIDLIASMIKVDRETGLKNKDNVKLLYNNTSYSKSSPRVKRRIKGVLIISQAAKIQRVQDTQTKDNSSLQLRYAL
jgi:hypothetical protein